MSDQTTTGTDDIPPPPIASTAIERRRDTLASDDHYMSRLPDMAREFSQSSLCPDVWRAKPLPANVDPNSPGVLAVRQENDRKVADLAIIGQSLAELDMRLSLNTLKQVYVVHGAPGYMAQLQILLASRFGVPIVPLDEESDGARAVVKIVGKDRQWHRVTVTMEEAQLAGWPARNSNYKTMPDRMLMARAVTKAIDRHAPEVKMMLPPADLEEAAAADWSATADLPEDETGELIQIPHAKRLVMQRLLARSTADAEPLSEKQAGAMAATLWSSHDLPSGKAMMPRSEVDKLLATIPLPEGATPAPQEAPSVMDQREAGRRGGKVSAAARGQAPASASAPAPASTSASACGQARTSVGAAATAEPRAQADPTRPDPTTSSSSSPSKENANPEPAAGPGRGQVIDVDEVPADEREREAQEQASIRYAPDEEPF